MLVVIVNYGLSSHIERLLAGSALVECEVMLVDNGSEPDQVRLLAERFCTQVLLLPKNYGFAGAVNRAVTQAGPHKQILLLNPDVNVSASQVQHLRSAFAAERVTGASPILINADRTIQVGTAGGPLTLSAFAIYYLFVSHVFQRARGAFFTRRQLVSGEVPSWLCMACLLLDGNAFEQFGAIPEEEIVYGEDLSWGYAASLAGAKFTVVRSLQVVHEQGAAGASRLFSGALARLAVSVNGPVRGRLAVMCIKVGGAIRGLSRWIFVRRS